MAIKYRTNRNVWTSTAPIVPIECLGETEHTILTPDGKASKDGEYYVYHASWEAAHLYLITVAKERVDTHRRSLQLAQRALDNITEMRPA